MFSLPLYQQVVAQALAIEPSLAGQPQGLAQEIDWSQIDGPRAAQPVDSPRTLRARLDEVQTGRWLALLVHQALLSDPTGTGRDLRRWLLHQHRLTHIIDLPSAQSALVILQKPARPVAGEPAQTTRVGFFSTIPFQTALRDLYTAYVRAGAPAAAQAYNVGKTDSSRHTAARRLLGNRLSALDLRIKAAARATLAHNEAAQQALRPLLRDAQTQADLLIDELVAEIERAHLKKRRADPGAETLPMDESEWERQVEGLVTAFARLPHPMLDNGESARKVEAVSTQTMAAIEAAAYSLSAAYYRSQPGSRAEQAA